MKLSQILSLLVVAVLLSSCEREPSASVDQDKIFTDYELFYNANLDKTYARATFRFSNLLGTQLELSDPSEVTFNGDVLTFRSALAYYEKEMAGFVESGTFRWSDIDGLVFTNAIQINTIAYPSMLDTIQRNASYEIIWEGAELVPKEIVTVTVNGENEGDAQIFLAADIGMEGIILSKSKLEKVGQGPGTIWMDRSYIPDLQEATSAGGRRIGRYRPVNKNPYFK